MLHVIETGGPGGAESVLDTIVGGLSSEAWHSLVVVPEEDWLSERLRSRGVDIVVLGSQRAGDYRFARALARLMQRFQPHVVHSHLLASAVYGTVAATLAGRPGVVCTFHGKPDVDPADPFLAVKSRIVGTHSNRIVYVSHHLRQYLEELVGLPPEIGQTIQNGVVFNEPNPTGREREEAGAGPDDILLGAVGNLRVPKDYPNLVRAAAIVCARHPHVCIAVAGGGGGSMKEELEELAAELGVADKIRFLGFRSDIPNFLSACDIFVSSSRSEGLPLAPLEAMGQGKPVVLTACGGPEEILVPGITGLLVPKEDPEALAEALCALVADPNLRAKLADAGQEDVRRRFSVERMIGEYEAVYEDAMRRQAAGDL